MTLKVLLLDNYDSFTYMLKDYIEQCGVQCMVMRNDEPELFSEVSKADVLVLSPGPQRPKDAGELMHVLEKFIHEKPVLGVCLGHQAIGEYFGATLMKAKQPKHGKVDPIQHFGNPLFNNIKSGFSATRYHSLVLQDLPQTLEIIATTDDDEIMGLMHKHLPVWGIQFHPESCTTEDGLRIIKNFLHLTELSL